jgi:hypothetical protein
VVVTTLANLGANDSLDIIQYGSPGALLNNPFAATSVNGVTVSGTVLNGKGAVGQQAGPGFPNATWNGGFAPGTYLISNQFGGDVAFSFGQGILGFGVSVDDAFSTFTGGSIEAFSDMQASISLGKFALPGRTSRGLIFAGIEDTTADIRAVIVHDNSNYFAFGPISLLEAGPAAASAPEPSALALTAIGFLAVIIFRRFTFARR